MPKRITHVFFRMLVHIPQVRRWLDHVTKNLVGATADDEKLWRFFKKALKWRIRYAIRKRIPAKRRPPNTSPRLRIETIAPVKPTRKFLIALTESPLSMEAAERCIASAKQYGEDHDLEIMPAIDQFNSKEFFIQNGLTWTTWATKHDHPSAMGCFSSHFKLWLRCMELGEPIVILEHDAIFRAPIPRLRFRHIIMLGKPHYAWEYKKRIKEANLREGREIVHPWGHLLGTHCYAITPEGAHKLVEVARRQLLEPVDVFICKHHVDILYYHPYPVSLNAQFSSIVKDFSPIAGYEGVPQR